MGVVPEDKVAYQPDWKDPYLMIKTFGSALIWISLNLSLAMTNKWLFQYRVGFFLLSYLLC